MIVQQLRTATVVVVVVCVCLYYHPVVSIVLKYDTTTAVVQCIYYSCTMQYRAICTSLKYKYHKTGNNRHEDRLLQQLKIRDSLVLQTRHTPFANYIEKSATGLFILQEGVSVRMFSKHCPFVVQHLRLTPLTVCVFCCGSHSA